MYQATHTVERLVERLLPRFSSDNQVLSISLKINASFYCGSSNDPDELGDYQDYTQINYLFHRPNNYTKVWEHISDKPVFNIRNPEIEWVMKSNHDSCWTSDGLRGILEARFNSYDVILQQIADDLNITTETARVRYGSRINVTTDVGSFHEFGSLHRAEVLTDPEDDRDYKHLVVVGEHVLEDTIVRYSGKFDFEYQRPPYIGQRIIVMKGSKLEIESMIETETGTDTDIDYIITSESYERKVTFIRDGVDDEDGNPVSNPIVYWDDQGTTCSTDINNIKVVR